MGRSGCRNPAVIVVNREGNDLGLLIGSQTAEIHRLAVLERLGPEDGRLLRVGQRARLHEAFARVGIHDRACVQKWRRDGGMLHHVVDASEFVVVRDGFGDPQQGGALRKAQAARHLESGHGQGGGHLSLNCIMGSARFPHNRPLHVRRLAMKRHTIFALGF